VRYRRRGILAALLGALVLAVPAQSAPPSLTASIVGEQPNGGGVFRFVQAVAISPGGATIFAGDMYSGVVQAFNRDGSFRYSIGLRAQRREPGRLGVVGGVATDRSGHVYVLDSENERVQVFDAADGRHLSSFGDNTLFDLLSGDPAIGAGISASGIAVDQRPGAAPVVFVVDQGRNRIARFTLDSATLTPAGPPAFAEPGLDFPQGLTLDPAGTRLYVADNRHDRVLVLDPQSFALLGQVGSTGSGPGQFDAPYDVAVDAQPAPRLYVGDNLNNRVDVFDATTLGYIGAFGAFGRTPGLFSIVRSVGALADDPRGGVLVADSANNRIQALDASGAVVAAWGIAGRSPGYFQRPRGVAFASDGATIAVADTFDHRIERFEPDGSYGGQLGLIGPFNGYATQGSGTGQFSLPAGVAFDASGKTVVSDFGNDRVVVLAPDGAVLRTVAVTNPRAVAAGPAGSVLVAEQTNPGGHIVRLDPDGTQTFERGGLVNPKAVAWDGTNVYAADSTRVFRGAAELPPPFGAPAWDHPSALAVHPADGTLYVAELRTGTANGARVLRGTPSGQLYEWDVIATEGAGDGQVNEPNGLALSPNGATLLIADTSNNRILRLDAPGHGPAPTVLLSVAIDQITRGSVTNATGIACATDCIQHYGVGRTVTLTARAAAGSTFAGWGGACAAATTAPTCTIAMTAAQSVSASFVAPPPQPQPPTQPPIQPPAQQAPPPPPPGPGVRVTSVRIVPALLHRARRANRALHRRVRRETRARVTLRLSRPARITATVALARPGVRRGSRCAAPPRERKRSDRACTRFVVRPGSRTLRLSSGVQRFTLTPTFAERRLPLGRYRLVLVALDSSANRVGPVNRAFRVLR
jgi:DNA-binding beta-propeller fold protein YncE